MNKLHEQQYQILLVTGDHDVDDADEQVHEITITEIQVHENHDAIEVQVVVELVEMHANADNVLLVDVQQVDVMVELDELVDGEHTLVDDEVVDEVDDEDLVIDEMVEIDEHTLIIDTVVETDDIDEMLDIGEKVEIDEYEHSEHIVDELVETDTYDEMVEVLGVLVEKVEIEYCVDEMVEHQRIYAETVVEMVEMLSITCSDYY